VGIKDNLFVRILKFGWEKFKSLHPSYANDYYDSVIQKVIHCRDQNFGYIEYQCFNCGQETKRVGFSCKSRFCIHCARKGSREFIDEIMSKLHPGVVYRHLILTIPEQLRDIFYQNRKEKDLFSRFINSAKDYINDVYRHVTGIDKLQTGCVVVLHLAGRKGNWNTHLHVVVINGGIDPATGKWINLPYFKYKNLMPKKWQYHLLKLIEEFDKSDRTLSLVKKLWKIYPKGFVNNFKKGDIPIRMGHLVNYLAKYISKPSISISSIKGCDFNKDEIVYQYKDHRTSKIVTTTCNVMTFIGRLVQQIFPKGFHNKRYFGLQHPSSYQKNRKIINDGLIKSDRKINSNDAFVAYAVGNWKWTNDNRICSKCKNEMIISKIWSAKYGIIYDALKCLVKNFVDPPVQDNKNELSNDCEVNSDPTDSNLSLSWKQLYLDFEVGQLSGP